MLSYIGLLIRLVQLDSCAYSGMDRLSVFETEDSKVGIQQLYENLNMRAEY